MRIHASVLLCCTLELLAQGPSTQPGGHSLPGLSPTPALERLGLKESDLSLESEGFHFHYQGMTRYLNGTRSVVTTSIDDSSRFVPQAIDALDRYGIKATVAVSTQRQPIVELWPRLRQAVREGHEIASHSRRHLCQWPDTENFCRRSYSRDEVAGSRDDILANTSQTYVWSWVYPCGNCADYEFVHERLLEAGYLYARNYPDEKRGGVLVPDLQSWAADPYNAAFTQVVQKKGGIAPAGRTDIADLNAKFDEVHQKEGIYHFVSHPQWLDYGKEHFYEQHLAYLGGRPDVWYVPLGPLQAYQTLTENSMVNRLQSAPGRERFAIHHPFDPGVYDGSLTLRFQAAGPTPEIYAGDTRLSEASAAPTSDWRAQYYRREGDVLLITIRPNSILEFRSVP